MRGSLLQCSHVAFGSLRDHLTRERRSRSQGYRHGSNVPKVDIDYECCSHATGCHFPFATWLGR